MKDRISKRIRTVGLEPKGPESMREDEAKADAYLTAVRCPSPVLRLTKPLQSPLAEEQHLKKALFAANQNWICHTLLLRTLSLNCQHLQNNSGVAAV